MNKTDKGWEQQKRRAIRLLKQGASVKHVSVVTHISYGAVYYWNKKLKKASKSSLSLPPGTPGWNADRHGCKTCQYRSTREKGCDYYMLTDQERGGDPADCTKYVEGNRVENGDI